MGTKLPETESGGRGTEKSRRWELGFQDLCQISCQWKRHKWELHVLHIGTLKLVKEFADKVLEPLNGE